MCSLEDTAHQQQLDRAEFSCMSSAVLLGSVLASCCLLLYF